MRPRVDSSELFMTTSTGSTDHMIQLANMTSTNSVSSTLPRVLFGETKPFLNSMWLCEHSLPVALCMHSPPVTMMKKQKLSVPAGNKTLDQMFGFRSAVEAL